MKLNLLLLAPVCFALILPSCNTANMKLQQAATKKGLICTNRVSLGQFLKWDSEQKTLTRINTLETPSGNLITDTSGSDELVKFEDSAKFTGGVTLTPQEVLDLQAEVTSKSSLEAKGLKKYAYRNIVRAITTEMNSDSEFIETMQVADAVKSNGRMLYVLVDELTIGNSLETRVEGISAISASGSSKKFKATSASIDFRISDTASLNISGSDGSDTRLFYRFSVFTPSLQEGVYKFGSVTNKQTLTDIREALQASEF